MSREHEVTIKELILTDEALRKYLDERVAHIENRIDQMEDKNQLQQQYNEQKQSELANKILINSDYINKLQDFQKDQQKTNDATRAAFDKTQQKIQNEKENLQQMINLSVDQLAAKVTEIEQFAISQIEGLTSSVDDFKEWTRDAINKKEAIMMKHVESVNQSLIKLVEETAADMNQKRIEIQIKYEKKFNKIKDVITKYFERYDADLEELKINMKVLNQKYADWSKILIEPSSLNEARLYALETRLHEEEDIRIKEYEYVRDLMKKLIFSLE